MASPSFFTPNFMFQAQPLHEEEEEEEEEEKEDPHNYNHRHISSILNPFLPSSNSPVFPTGTAAAMAGKRSASFSGNAEAEEEEISDDCSQHGEKKRRLNVEQVRTLEKNFELGNKLEPERKMQLAISLGLQPRQIAIWFQNRRARWKTKQLEKDYDLLKVQLQSIEAENSALHAQNKKLQAQISALKGREAAELINLNKETEGPCSNNRSENSSEINLERSLNRNQSLQFLPMISPKLLRSSSPTSDLHCSRTKNAIPEEQFGHLLYGMEDQTAFWPWPDHHFHHH